MPYMRLFVEFALLGAVAAMAAGPPVAEISNGRISATVYLPDPMSGFYQGTRFDWSGVVRSLEANGHSYYGPWFTKRSETVRDFIYDGAQTLVERTRRTWPPRH